MPEISRSRGSVALDGLRAFSSMAVFLGHGRAMLFQDLTQFAGLSPLAWVVYLATRFGHAAVIVFFVVSGYLVGGSTLKSWKRGEFRVSRYAVTRLSRLWLAMIPALIIGVILDRIGLLNFASHPIYAGGGEWSSIMLRPVADSTSPGIWLGNVVFLQSIVVPPFGSNGPLWSMANEFWYYVLFPLILVTVFNRGWGARLAGFAAILAVGAFVGWPILTKLPLWLAGAGAAAIPFREIANRKTWIWIAGAGLLLLGLAPTINHRLGLGEAINLAADYVTAIDAAALIVLLAADRSISTMTWFERACSGMANFSFSLYLLHMPILALGSAMLLADGRRWMPDGLHVGIWLLFSIAIIAVAFGHSLLFERPVKTVREWILRKTRAESIPAGRLSPP